MAITRIADLPLPEREPLELLALVDDRTEVDVDYAGFGWAWLDDVELATSDGASVLLRRALVVAVHSADEQPEGEDIELLFELPGQSVLVPLSKWLPVALPRLPPADDLVLVLCNPKHVPLGRSPSAAHPRIHYALGDATSWLDFDERGHGHVRLSATRWQLAGTP